MDSVEKVKEFCRLKNIRIRKLEKDLHFGNGYITRLRKGKIPYERMVLIADYLNVPLDALITEEIVAMRNALPKDSDEAESWTAEELLEIENFKNFLKFKRQK